jgi:predicted HTH domain antitoxin
MTKTMSIRMDKENFEFVSRLSKQEKGDISKTVRDLVYKGRIMLAIEKYNNGEASLGKAAELAGLSVGDMMTTLEQYGVKSNLEVEDYLEGLDNLKKVW